MINLDELRESIRRTFSAPNPRMSPLYKLLRDEMTRFGHWKAKSPKNKVHKPLDKR